MIGGGGADTSMAVLPNRCQHTKDDGTRCGSPAVRQNKFCYFHKRWHEDRIVIHQARARRRCVRFEVPILEDSSAIQLSRMKVMRQLANGQMDGQTAGLLIYALQTATTNLRLTNFAPDQADGRDNPEAAPLPKRGRPRLHREKLGTVQ
jgi:hypothetical protein